MNTQSNAAPGTGAYPQVAMPVSAMRLWYWSVLREFWENRYLYIAPLAVAGVFLFGYLINAIHSPGQLAAQLTGTMNPGMDHPSEISSPFDMSAGLMMAVSILMSVFYCAEALHGERRDRSILFWKSLPVSDVTTVLSKASVALLVLPVFISAITLALWLMMLGLSSVALLGAGGSFVALWARIPIFKMTLLMVYHLLTAHALWPAPVYCWLLLVSGWARRAPLLWAVLPILALGALEKIAFHTWHFASLVAERFIGATDHAGSSPDYFPTNPMAHITPVSFLAEPGLWFGLIIAAAFLVGAISLRRSQGPI